MITALRVIRFLGRLYRFVLAACPGWLVFLWVVFAFIPLDPLDEVIPATITLVVLVFQPQRIPRGVSAWRGGKAHRHYDRAYARHTLDMHGWRQGLEVSAA